MNNGITRAFQMTALLLSVSLVTTSCHNSSSTREAESSLPLGVTPIVTNQNQSEPDSSIIENGNIADTTRVLRIQDDWFDDSFFLLDNSSGYVNIYEIDVELPRSRSSQWAAEHSRAEVFDNINTGKWESDDNLTWAIGWFFGIPFSFELEAPPEHGIHPEDSDVTYWPPLDTVEKTTETIHSVSISSLPDGGELSFRELSGSENQDIQLACFELNNSAFPRETGYLPDKCDSISLIGLAEYYVDRIPVGGSMHALISSSGDYVYEYGGVVGPTVGSPLIMGSSTYARNDNTVIAMYRAKEFSIKSIVEENLPVKPIPECIQGVKDALSYYPFDLDNVQFYAAELVYEPLSDFNIEARDFDENGHTYLVPVWHVYYRATEMDMLSGTGFVSINAITGEALYSSEYSYQDKRIFENGM